MIAQCLKSPALIGITIAVIGILPDSASGECPKTWYAGSFTEAKIWGVPFDVDNIAPNSPEHIIKYPALEAQLTDLTTAWLVNTLMDARKGAQTPCDGECPRYGYYMVIRLFTFERKCQFTLWVRYGYLVDPDARVSYRLSEEGFTRIRLGGLL